MTVGTPSACLQRRRLWVWMRSRCLICRLSCRRASWLARASTSVIMDQCLAALDADTSFDWDAPDLELRVAQHLGDLAGHDFERHARGLRAFMALIPVADRQRLRLTLAVWKRLYGAECLHAITSHQLDNDARVPLAVIVDGGGDPDGDSLQVMFDVACGVRRYAPDLDGTASPG